VSEDREGYDADLDVYHGVWRDEPWHAEALTRYHLDLLGLAGVDPRGKAVLDAGCGYGFTLLLYGLLGAEELHGIDLDPARAGTVAAYRDLLPEELAGRLDVRLGNVAALDLPDASVDLMLSIEAVGVYLDVEAFAAEAARVLRPGGTLLVAEANNALNPRQRARTLEIWEAYERGTPGQMVHEHRIVEPYVNRRERLIRASRPELDPARVRTLADQTSGLTAGQIAQALGDHLDRGGPAPERPYRSGDLPIAPEGVAVERMVDPYELAGMLGRHGFEARVRGYWGGAGGRPQVRAANRLLSAGGRLTIRTAQAFRVVATRV
jgi:SAM-dependent methyltransferase